MILEVFQITERRSNERKPVFNERMHLFFDVPPIRECGFDDRERTKV